MSINAFLIMLSIQIHIVAIILYQPASEQGNSGYSDHVTGHVIRDCSGVYEFESETVCLPYILQ